MNTLEKLKQVREVLEGIHLGNMTPMAEEAWNKAITAIEQTIEQLEQAQPFAEIRLNMTGGNAGLSTHIVQLAEGYYPAGTKLYTAPPPRQPWVGLTPDEMPTLTAGLGPITLMPHRETEAFIRAIEAKLKEKNT